MLFLDRLLKPRKRYATRKIDNWQYINCVNLWVRFLCCHYKDYNLHPLLSEVQVIRGVAHLFPGTRYLPLRLRLVQMLNELGDLQSDVLSNSIIAI
ncbi:hypothetical protein SORBI_3010G114100 [Sorghum bicolor]|uniref:Uncharacterized protein n=1 Tax=Sorghum bicolor TaxID=4558 RepID=C5Z8H6_SORBI|nr:hypothetical protein SORBI_3010G114100 [Sorghum bicolor]